MVEGGSAGECKKKFSLGMTRMDRTRMSTSEGQCMLDVLEMKSERSD